MYVALRLPLPRDLSFSSSSQGVTVQPDDSNVFLWNCTVAGAVSGSFTLPHSSLDLRLSFPPLPTVRRSLQARHLSLQARALGKLPLQGPSGADAASCLAARVLTAACATLGQVQHKDIPPWNKRRGPHMRAHPARSGEPPSVHARVFSERHTSPCSSYAPQWKPAIKLPTGMSSIVECISLGRINRVVHLRCRTRAALHSNSTSSPRSACCHQGESEQPQP